MIAKQARNRIIGRLTAVFLIAVFVLSHIIIAPVFAQEKTPVEIAALERLVGVFEGEYVAADGYTWGARITIYRVGNGDFTAIFECHSISEEMTERFRGTGSWRCAVSFDVNTNTYAIEATEWIEQHPYWVMDSFINGVLSDDGNTLSGTVRSHGWWGRTTSFEIHRVSYSPHTIDGFRLNTIYLARFNKSFRQLYELLGGLQTDFTHRSRYDAWQDNSNVFYTFQGENWAISDGDRCIRIQAPLGSFILNLPQSLSVADLVAGLTAYGISGVTLSIESGGGTAYYISDQFAQILFQGIDGFGSTYTGQLRIALEGNSNDPAIAMVTRESIAWLSLTGGFWPDEYALGLGNGNVTGQEERFYNLSFLSKITDEYITVPVRWTEMYFSDTQFLYYHNPLAITAMVLSASAYDGVADLESNLAILGFTTIESHFHDFTPRQTAAYTLAAKTTVIDGQPVNLIAVVVRGTAGTFDNWVTNLTFNVINGRHNGFNMAARELRNRLNSFRERLQTNTGVNDFKYFITGHSQGAAVANILAADLINDEHNLRLINEGRTVVKAITFATPNTVTSSRVTYRYRGLIINIVNPVDIVTGVPPFMWRYGSTFVLPDTSVRRLLAQDAIGAVHNPFLSQFNILTGISFSEAARRIPTTVAIGGVVDSVFNSGITMHFPEMYIAYLMAGEPSIFEYERGRFVDRVIEVRCPVDVRIYNEENELIHIIRDNDAESIHENFIAWTDGDVKFLYFPWFAPEYQVRFVGTDSGEMTLIIHHTDIAAHEITEVAVFSNVTIEVGRNMELSADRGVDTGQYALFVVGENGQRIAEINTDGAEIPMAHEANSPSPTPSPTPLPSPPPSYGETENTLTNDGAENYSGLRERILIILVSGVLVISIVIIIVWRTRRKRKVNH